MTPTNAPFLSLRQGTPLTHTLGAVLCANATFVNVIISPDTMPIFIVKFPSVRAAMVCLLQIPLAISYSVCPLAAPRTDLCGWILLLECAPVSKKRVGLNRFPRRQ